MRANIIKKIKTIFFKISDSYFKTFATHKKDRMQYHPEPMINKKNQSIAIDQRRECGVEKCKLASVLFGNNKSAYRQNVPSSYDGVEYERPRFNVPTE